MQFVDPARSEQPSTPRSRPGDTCTFGASEKPTPPRLHNQYTLYDPNLVLTFTTPAPTPCRANQQSVPAARSTESLCKPTSKMVPCPRRNSTGNAPTPIPFRTMP